MKHLSVEERIKIEIYLKEGYAPYCIAGILGRSPRTIYQEIKRGSFDKLNSDLTVSTVYCYDVGERVRIERGHNKGRALAIGNNQLLSDNLENLILSGYSPYAALEFCRSSGIDVNICLTTLYSYIHKDFFLKLSSKHLKRYKLKSPDTNKRQALNNLRGRSISERPDYINKRSSFGHWELDTVYGSQGSEDVLFVLTERLSRYELIMQQPHKSIQCCKDFIDNLEIYYGSYFYKFFKSITCDNGVEFLNQDAIECSCFNPDIKRTTVYYCHAFASSERGSNENQNRLIRYFIPKGSDIDCYDSEQISFIQDYMNTLPRKIFGGRSSASIAAEYGFS